MYSPGTDAPYVYSGARYRPQPHSSIDATRFGLPKARWSRWTHSMLSTIADVDGDAEANTTDSGPWSRARARSRAATVSSASSHVIGCQPGSGSSFGRVRFNGCVNRPGWAVIRGASLPFTHRALPVGWDGSRLSANVPPVTVARAPQRETHNGQYVGTSIGASPIGSP